MRVAITGAHGFLGWHTRVLLRTLTGHDVVAVGRDEWPRLTEMLDGVDAVIHIAGVNRGGDADVHAGNLSLASELVDALRRSGGVDRLVYASTIRAGDATPYGQAKAEAGRTLASWAASHGAAYREVVLPNLFGEHGRPHYNSVVATFVEHAHRGTTPDVRDSPVELLHAQDAAQALVDAIDSPRESVRPRGTSTSVPDVWGLLTSFHRQYDRAGQIPDLDSEFTRALFNTYRAGGFPANMPIRLAQHRDQRGVLTELVRSRAREAQVFVSSTGPGHVRGEHFHRRKIERFAVVDGRARIALRRMLTDEVVRFDVCGSEPVLVDMPTLWTHHLVSTGSSAATAVFWVDELLDPADTDTFREPVEAESGGAA